jgi:hypothetical protein
MKKIASVRGVPVYEESLHEVFIVGSDEFWKMFSGHGLWIATIRGKYERRGKKFVLSKWTIEHANLHRYRLETAPTRKKAFEKAVALLQDNWFL